MKNNDEQGRGKPNKERPWCWQEKAMVRTIRHVFDATNDVSSALAVYLTMTEIASDEGSDTFTKPINEIARRAGLSYRTASSLLDRFDQLGFLTVTRNTIAGTKLKSPSTYTLRNYCLSIGNSRFQAPLPRIEKKTEKSQKNVLKERAREPTITASTATADFLELEKIANQHADDSEKLCVALQPHFQHLNVRREHRAYIKWRTKHQRPATPRGFVHWLGRAEPTLTPLPKATSNSNGAAPQRRVSDTEYKTELAKFKAANRELGLIR